jgi:hypothetical protein
MNASDTKPIGPLSARHQPVSKMTSPPPRQEELTQSHKVRSRTIAGEERIRVKTEVDTSAEEAQKYKTSPLPSDSLVHESPIKSDEEIVLFLYTTFDIIETRKERKTKTSEIIICNNFRC